MAAINCHKMAYGRIIVTVCGCFCMLVVGHIYALAAYMNAIKDMFNYSQSDVELLAAFSNFGMCFGVPAGFMFDWFGATLTVVTSLVMSTVGLGLELSTTYLIAFYSRTIWLQCIYFFLAGQGGNLMYMCVLTVTAYNFPPHNRGKLFGLLDGAFSAGASIVSLIYSTLFVYKNQNGGTENDLEDFYLFLLVAFIIAGIIGTIFLRIVPDMNEIDDTCALLHDFQKVDDVTGCQLLRRLDFHCLFWSALFGIGLQIMFQNNLVTFLRSFKEEEYAALFTTAFQFVVFLGKAGSGFVSDLVLRIAPRVSVLIATNILQTIFLGISIFYARNVAFLFTGMVIIAFSNGAVWCLTPTLLSEYYGVKHFGKNWGATLFGTSISAFILQSMFGYIYDSNIEVKGQRQCDGQKCFRLSFIVACFLSVLCMIMYLYLLMSRKMRSQNDLKTHELTGK